MADISTTYRRGNTPPSSRLPRFGKKNGPEPYQGLPSTPSAGTTLQGREPRHTIPACYRASRGRRYRGLSCPRAYHIIATSPLLLPHRLPFTRTQRGTTNQHMPRYNNSCTSSTICQGRSRGGICLKGAHPSVPHYHPQFLTQWDSRRS